MAAQYLLAVPSKATKSVDFTGPLTRFVANNYDDQPSRYQDAISEFQQLREATVVKSPDKHETGLDLITRYYDQLVAMDNKLPISEGQIRIKLHWSDAFAKGGLFGGKKEAAQVSGTYERCCALFNIGALQSQIAKSQNFENDDGLKTAAKHFQGAAGTFQLLQEQVFAHLQTAPTPDLSAECTTALMQLMLAQAQESFCIKAAKDKIKEALIAKIAMQCSDLYADAYSSMQVGAVKQIWEKGWLSTASAKQAYFHCVAQHRMGLVAQANKNYGEAVARMKRAQELLHEAEKKGEGAFKPYDVTATVKRDFEAVSKDNNFIYNDLVPDFGTLEPPGKATLAKPVQFTSPASNFVDLFVSLVPLAVSQALQAYNSKKDDLVNGECEKLRQATSELNEVLAGRNLPAAIEDTGGDSIPESIQEKAGAVQGQGGLRTLEEKINNMPELVQCNREILTETARLLDEEEREDTELKNRFKEKWTRQPSAGLTENLRKEVNKYKAILETASGADKVVKDKFQANREAIVLLGKPIPELQASLPKAGTLSSRVQGSQCVLDLRGLMEEVGTLKAERETIERTLRDNVADITPKFLQALKDFGDVDEEAISEAHLRTEYGHLQTQVQETTDRQGSLVQRITSAHAEFEQLTSGQSVGEREAKLKELAAGYDAFQELCNNLSEGSKFYNDLTPLLLKVQSKISDFVFARRTEKDDLLKDLQKTIANQPAVAPPTNPQYQQQSRQPPVRPPPPQATPAQRPPPPQAAPAQRPPPQLPPAQPSAPPPGSQPYPQQPPAQGYQPYAPYGHPPPQPGYQYPPHPGGYYAPHPGAPYGAPPQGAYGHPQPMPPYGHPPYGQPPPGSYYQPQQPYQPPPSRR